MAYSGEEMEALEKRLKAVEEAINELKENDLVLAREIGLSSCSAQYNMVLLTRRGEERQAYVDFWKKRLEDTEAQIRASQTVKAVFDVAAQFDHEFSTYVRAEKVKTAAEATEIAHSYIKKYSPIALPLKAVKEGDVWVVDLDVGALAVKIARVKVDARTGDVLSHEIPEK